MDKVRNLSYCSFGSNALLGLLNQLEEHTDGARTAKDIEYVHKVRVASRRLRSTLLIFEACFPKDQVRRWRAAIKGVTQSLGMARDADVQIEFLKQYLSTTSKDETRRGVRLLLEEYLRKRASMQEAVIESLDGLRDSGAPEEIRSACGRLMALAVRANVDKATSSVLHGADVNIADLIDEVLALQDCVDDEDDARGHHELRIAAKHLRYAMEIFAPAFKNGLKTEIARVTKLQDILGEVHDSDVWIDYIDRFVVDLRTELLVGGRDTDEIRVLERDLVQFKRDMKQRRMRAYGEFVGMWYRLRKERLFERLEDKTGAMLARATEEWLRKLTHKRAARIGLISDVHGNLHALEAVVANAGSHGVTEFMNAGDLIGYGALPNEVVKKLRSPNVLSVVGNYDLELLAWDRKRKPKDVMEIGDSIAIRELKESSARFLRALPKKLTVKIGGKRILLTHGSPDSIEEYIDSDTSQKRLKKLAKIANADIVVTGHSHNQFSGKVERVTFVNPGSVGRPDDNDPRAAYAILSLSPMKIEMHRVHYDVGGAADVMRMAGFPECIPQMLVRGISAKAVMKADKKLAKKSLWRAKESLEQVHQAALKYGAQDGHAEHVAELALKMFDQLRKTHAMGQKERYWLNCAALLHDIGLSEGSSGHHKTSQRLILNDQDLPFTIRERMVIGSVARYHRRSLPDRRHYPMEQLSSNDRERVKMLASFLRLADGLDISHSSAVKTARIRMGRTAAGLTCFAYSSPLAEARMADKKKDMFEKVFGKELRVSWKTVVASRSP